MLYMKNIQHSQRYLIDTQKAQTEKNTQWKSPLSIGAHLQLGHLQPGTFLYMKVWCFNNRIPFSKKSILDILSACDTENMWQRKKIGILTVSNLIELYSRFFLNIAFTRWSFQWEHSRFFPNMLPHPVHNVHFFLREYPLTQSNLGGQHLLASKETWIQLLLVPTKDN